MSAFYRLLVAHPGRVYAEQPSNSLSARWNYLLGLLSDGTIMTASPGTATFDGDQHSGAAGFAAISTAPRLYLQDDVCLGLGSVVLLDTDRL